MKHKSILVILFVIGVITACDKRPNEVLSDRKMEAVMVDLFLFEGTAHIKNITVDDSLKTNYYNQILKKHGVTLAQYDSSLVWYMKNPKHYVNLNEAVTKQLKKIEHEIKAGNYIRPIAPNDSLDSIIIRVDRREMYIVPSISTNSKYIIKEKGLVSGDIFKIRFQVRLDGELRKLRASSILRVNYADNTHDEKKTALTIDTVFNTYNLSLATDSKKKITAINVNLFKLETILSPTQRIYIHDINMQRVFNPYRKIK